MRRIFKQAYLFSHDIPNLGWFGWPSLHYDLSEIIWSARGKYIKTRGMHSNAFQLWFTQHFWMTTWVAFFATTFLSRSIYWRAQATKLNSADSRSKSPTLCVSDISKFRYSLIKVHRAATSVSAVTQNALKLQHGGKKLLSDDGNLGPKGILDQVSWMT